MNFSMKLSGKKKKKTYGLVLPASKQETKSKPNSQGLSRVFDVNSDDYVPGKESTLSERQMANRKAKRHNADREIAKILDSNPDAFSYDSVYDDLQNTRRAEYDLKQNQKLDRKVRYVDNIRKSQSQRQTRIDAAKTRKMVRDHESTDHLYQSKDAFVTRAYKQQLTEQKLQQIKDKAMDARNKTVEKDDNMMSFYGNMLTLRTGGALNKQNDIHISSTATSTTTKKRSRSRSRSQSRSHSHSHSDSDSDSASRRGDTDREAVKNKDGIVLKDALERRKHAEYENLFKTKPAEMKAKQKHLQKRMVEKCEKRNDENRVMSAKERYLARKRSKAIAPQTADDDD